MIMFSANSKLVKYNNTIVNHFIGFQTMHLLRNFSDFSNFPPIYDSDVKQAIRRRSMSKCVSTDEIPIIDSSETFAPPFAFYKEISQICGTTGHNVCLQEM
jgi:hypothetical protein